jgi:metal-responsive CopG/Arc/MetJ family transcriptional regulator
MRNTITISVPEQMKSELDDISKAEGVSRSDVVRESIRDYIFVRRFRGLRSGMVQKAAAQGVFTDEDVFEAMS